MDVRVVGNVASPAQTAPSTSVGGGQGFSSLMDRVLGEALAPQREADQALLDLAAGKTDQLHQVLLSVAKADLTFRLMLEMRNRLTESYQEVQRMQI